MSDLNATKLSAEALARRFDACGDFCSRAVWPGGRPGTEITLCWIDGLVSARDVSEEVLRPLTDALRVGGVTEPEALASSLRHGSVYCASVQSRHTVDDAAADLLRGCCALMFDGTETALCFEAKSELGRAVSQPTVEKTVKGGKEAFVETLRINTALLRRRLRTPDLKLLTLQAGRRSATDAAIFYIEGLTDPTAVSELRRRLGSLDVDGLTATGNLEQYITDHPGSPFPQLLHTERPDSFAAQLLAGRTGLLVDGLPMGFLLPATLPAFLRVNDDRALHWAVASLLTLLRWLSLLVSLTLPAVFTAISMYHQEMIPTQLLMSMIEAKQKVPCSVAFEILVMLAAFELLMEAGLRLPDPVGDTVSIIGALIVGQSAVEARIVSPISVIVVATAAICGFTQPSRDLGAAIRLFRALMVFASVFLGLFGLALCTALLLWYLCSLESFRTPYLSPMTEGGFYEVLKALIRLPLPKDKLREAALRPQDRRNQA